MNRIYKNQILRFIESKYFKILLIIIAFLCFYVIYKKTILFSGLELENISNFEKIIYSLNDKIFFSSVFILCFLIIDLFIDDYFTILSELELRYRNNKEYSNFKRNMIILINTLLFIISIFVMIIICNFISSGYRIHVYSNYSINNFIYMVYSLIKTYLLIIIITNFNFIFIKRGYKNTIVILNLLFVIFTIFYNPNLEIINNITQMPIILTDYIGLYNYSNFQLELSCFIFYILMMGIILVLLDRILAKWRSFKNGN